MHQDIPVQRHAGFTGVVMAFHRVDDVISFLYAGDGEGGLADLPQTQDRHIAVKLHFAKTHLRTFGVCHIGKRAVDVKSIVG